MTNAEIIEGEMLLRGIEKEVHTFVKWKQLGYSVKKGEKAAFETRIWKKVKPKAKDGEEPEEKFVLVKSFFFTEDQVEQLKEKTA